MDFNNKKIFFIIGILVIAISFNLAYIAVSNTHISDDVKTTDLDTVKKQNSNDLADVENEIKNIRSTFNTEELSTLNFKDIFSSTVIIGDSQVEGLAVYDILNKSSVIAKMGTNINKTTNSSIAILKDLSPSSVITLFGMNDILIYQDNIDLFITDYKKLITAIQKQVPNSKIIINGVMPVSEHVYKNRTIYTKIPDYNKALKKMCKDLDITFVDSSHVVLNNPQLVGPDGMHFAPDFYRHWLNLLKEYI